MCFVVLGRREEAMAGAGSCRRGEALQGITSFPRSAPLTPSTHRDLRNSGPGDLQSWSTWGHPRLEIYGRGVSGEAINEVDGRTGASMDGIDQQAWEDPLRLRSKGQWSHEMSSVSNVSSAGPPQGSIPADLPPGRALSLYQWSPQSSLPKGFILLTAEMSVS